MERWVEVPGVLRERRLLRLDNVLVGASQVVVGCDPSGLPGHGMVSRLSVDIGLTNCLHYKGSINNVPTITIWIRNNSGLDIHRSTNYPQAKKRLIFLLTSSYFIRS